MASLIDLNRHDICLHGGDIIERRWYIGHKLGAGSFGQTYLAIELNQTLVQSVMEEEKEKGHSQPPSRECAYKNNMDYVAIKFEIPKNGKFSNYEHIPPKEKWLSFNLIREASILRKMQKGNIPAPNIVEIHNVGWHRYRYSSLTTIYLPYIVMDLHGENLAVLRRMQPRRCFSLSTSVRLSYQMLCAIEQVYQHGYVHRDIKPSNFVMGRPPLRHHDCILIDFGISKQHVVNHEAPIQPK